MQKCKNDAIANLSANLNTVSSNLVRQVFRPLVSTASPLTIGSTSVQAHDNEWLSPEAQTSVLRPLLEVPIKRSNTCKIQHSTVITWRDREAFGEYMHDCYGGNFDYELLPVLPMDPVKHPWDTD